MSVGSSAGVGLSGRPAPSSSSGGYRPRQAEYAILLTYIPSGIRVRATPAAQLASLRSEEAAAAGIRSLLTVHQPSLRGLPPATSSPAAARSAARVLELDIDHSELTVIGTPHIEKLHASGGASGVGDGGLTFLELLIAQLCVHVTQAEEYKLVFTANATSDATKTESMTHDAPNGAVQQQSMTTSMSSLHSFRRVSVTSTSSVATSEDEYDDGEIDDPELVAEMIPPAVAAAAISEAPLKPRSPPRRSRAHPPPSLPFSMAREHASATPQRTYAQPGTLTHANLPPQHPPTPPVAHTASPASSALGVPTSGATSGTGPTAAMFSPNVAALMDDLSLVRRENADLRHRNAMLQAQVDLHASREAAHASEVASLRKRLEESKDALHETEEQLFLLRSSIKHTPPPTAATTGGAAAVKSDDDRGALLASLQAQLSHSSHLTSSVSQALASLQHSFRSVTHAMQHEFAAAGHTLRLSVDVAKHENRLVQELRSARHTDDDHEDEAAADSTAPWAPFSPTTTRAQQAALEQSFAADAEFALTASADAELDDADFAASLSRGPSTAHSPSASGMSTPTHGGGGALQLDRLMSSSRTLEQRATRLLQAMHERNRLLHASVAALEHTGVQIRREVTNVRAQADEARLSHANGASASAASSRRGSIARSASVAALEARETLEAQATALGIKGQQMDLLRRALADRDAQVEQLTASLVEARTRRSLAENHSAASVATQLLSGRDASDAMEALQAQIASLTSQLAHATGERAKALDQVRGLEAAALAAQKQYGQELTARDELVASLDRQLTTFSSSTSSIGGGAKSSAPISSRAVADPDHDHEVSLLRSELSTLRRLHTDKGANILSIHNEINAKNMSLVRLQSENLHLAEENQRLDSILLQAKDQALVLSNKLTHFENAIVPGLATENETLQAERDGAVDDAEKARSLLVAAEREVRSLRAEVDSLQHRASLASSAPEHARVALDHSLIALRTECAQLQTRVAEVELENQTLSSRLSKNARREQATQRDAQTAEHEKAEVKAALDAQKNENAILATHIATTKSNMQTLQAQHEDLQRMYKTLLDSKRHGGGGDDAANTSVVSNFSTPTLENGRAKQPPTSERHAPSSASPMPHATPAVQPADLAALIKENTELKLSLQAQSRLANSSSRLDATATQDAARLRADQEAALQQYDLLRNQTDLHVSMLADKDEQLEAAQRKSTQQSTYLAQAETTIQSLQAQVRKQQTQNDDSIQTIQTLNHQVRSLQSSLQQKQQAHGSVESDLTTTLEEKARLTSTIGELRTELHVKSLAVSDGLGIIDRLEAELASFKLNVLLPYQKNHLDIGCEARRLQLEVELRNAEESNKAATKALRAKEAHANELASEIERTKASLESGNREWATILPTLRKEKAQLEEVLEQVATDLQDFAAALAHTKRDKRAVLRQTRAAAAADNQKDQSPFDTSADIDPESHEFDLEAHVAQLSPLGGSGSGSMQKYHSVFSLLLQDLAPTLTHYVDLIRFQADAEATATSSSRTHREQVASLEAERSDLIRRLKLSESQIDHLEAQGHRAQAGAQELDQELRDLRISSKATASRHESVSSQLDAAQLEKKDLQQHVDALLSLQKNWDLERQLMIDTAEDMTRQREKATRAAETMQKEHDALVREQEATATRLEATKKELARLQTREREWNATAEELSDTTQRLTAVEDDLAQRDAQVRDARDELSTRKAECRALADDLVAVKKARDNQSRTIEKLRAREEELARQNTQLESEVEEMVRDAREPLLALRETHAQVEADLRQAQLKCADLAAKASSLATEKEEQTRTSARHLAAQKDAAAKVRAAFDAEQQEAQTEHEEAVKTIRAQLKAVTEELKVADEKHAESERAAAAHQHATNKQLQSSRLECQRLADRLSSLEQEHSALASSKASLEASFASLQKTADKLESDLAATVARESAAVERAKKAAKEAEKASRDALTAAREATRDAQQAHRVLEKEFDRASARLEQSDREVSRIERGLEHAQLERKEAEMREKATAKSLAAVERDLAAKTDALDRAERGRADDAKQLAEKLHAYEAQTRKAQDAQFALEARFKESEVDRAQLTRAVHDAERRAHESEVERAATQRVVQESERRVRELESEVSSSQRAVQDAERRVHETTMHSESLSREKVPRLETAVAQLTHTLHERTAERDASKKRLAEAEYALGEGRQRLDQELVAARKEAAAAQVRHATDADVISQLRAAIQSLERDQSYKSAQWSAESSNRDAELLSSQQALSKAAVDRDLAVERADKYEKKLRELSAEHDALAKSHQKSVAAVHTLESAAARAQEREADCRDVHVRQWEPLLERSTKDLKAHVELVSLLRQELADEKADAKKVREELKRIAEDTLAKKDRSANEDAAHAKRAHQAEIERMRHAAADDMDQVRRATQAEIDQLRDAYQSEADQMRQMYESLREEFTTLTADHGALTSAHESAHASHLDRVRELESSLEGRTHDLDRIRSMLGVEWEELLSMSDNAVLRERARSLFSGGAQLSIAQLQDLVQQQNLHLTDVQGENAELNQIIRRLKDELEGYKQQKRTEHSTMDKLLAANKRLQHFIDSQGMPLDVRSRTNGSYAVATPSTQASRVHSPHASPIRSHRHYDAADTGAAVAPGTTSMMPPTHTSLQFTPGASP